ncbi:DUF4982 domain-containing protein [Salegentibacter sp. BDJ18]|uniref:glycoside hydrolase family 2 TIM barrel-domain containing protein n=1 Tax=Salegentibacter sp. BDJ18 TaxID=2816376 RepID=UPI001AAF4526|nr:glycoside hydrolase family 2 TIM barrel-domain containing protein [Salegentibacter sp. BDJ18]MBO2543171.1 DUF4982 domain-containing protein [Salegentibacter sp. BDJ18]
MNYKKNKLFILLGILIFSDFCLTAQNSSRIAYTINSDWNFHKGDLKGPENVQEIDWEEVTIPHTWNTRDVMDDEMGYYRGISWYKRKLVVPASYKEKQVFLHFEGANQEVEVFVNGNRVGEHLGGYTAFTFPITEHLNFSEDTEVNEILIKVDNSYNEDIPTLTADFTFFGGIYRDVYLIATSQVHFDLLDHGSKGVFISTPNVSEKLAEVEVKSQVVNDGEDRRTLRLVNTIRDADFNLISQEQKKIKLKAGEKQNLVQSLKVPTPYLWSPEDPYLYRVTTSIYEKEELLDEVSTPLGLRWFEFDAEKGFFLNGKFMKLIGTNRHQDFEGLGNAVPDELAKRDVQLLKEMGGNFLRVAHYPHDPTVLETCDRLGILAAVEIPIVNRITESEAFAENSKNMQVEMIRQGYNHPSVIIWAYMNEVLLRPRFADDKERQDVYYRKIAELAQELEDITRSEDPYRYTMIPNHGHMDRYERVGLTEIPMIVGWNLYQGWYSSGIEKFASNLDRHKKKFPNKPMIVTEYGADADPRLRSFAPVRFDMTVEYANHYHQVYLEEIMKRNFVVGATVWNLADFSSETRHDVVPHVNNKGIMELDRKPKDTYFYYQSQLLAEPFIRIASRNWTKRSGISEKNASEAIQPLEVFTNLEEAYLLVNGEKLETQKAENNVIIWQVPFRDGINSMEVVSEVNGKKYKDHIEVDFYLLPYDLSEKNSFKDLSINLGTRQRIFVDELTQQVWMYDQPYREGSWGHLGGETYEMENNSRTSYGTDQNILGTDLDPVYQTQLVGIKQYKIDVPNGLYDVILHFAEFETTEKSEVVAYNLATEQELKKDGIKEPHQRIFSVTVNSEPIFLDLNLASDFEPLRAINRKIRIDVRDGQGILINFESTEGRAVLNGLEVKKIY